MVAIFVGTTPFIPLARYELTRRGVLEPRTVFVEHPLGGAEPGEILTRADGAREIVARSVGANVESSGTESARSRS